MLSSVAKKKKNIIALATVESLLGVAIDEKKQKPTIIKLYNFTKGATDIINQKIWFYNVKTKSRWWTILSLVYLLDTIRVNACSVYAMNNGLDPKKQNSYGLTCQIISHTTDNQTTKEWIDLSYFERNFTF